MPINFGGNKNKKTGFGIQFGAENKSTAGTVAAKNLPPALEDVEYTSAEPNHESDSNDELNHVHEAFTKSAHAETAAKDDYLDEEFYTTIVFTNKQQRQAFFKGLGVDAGEQTDFRFVNGLQLANLLHITLPQNSPVSPVKFRVANAILKLCQLVKPKQK